MPRFDLNEMGGTLFHRKNKDKKAGAITEVPDMGDQTQDEFDASEFEDDELSQPPPPRNRRPKETDFTQQRMKAYDPVFTPNLVLPIYLIFAVIFVIVGGCLLAVSNRVNEIRLFYQDCATAAPTDDFEDMPETHYKYHFHQFKDYDVAPKWKFVDDPNDDSNERGTCQIQFPVPGRFAKSVFISYYIEEFWANHRRFVLSYNEDQIKGKRPGYHKINSGTGLNCKPLSRNKDNGKLYYPCGLIANSMFNDTYPFELINLNDPNDNYILTNKGINYKSDRHRFKKTRYNHTEITPPPYWEKQFPNGYNETNIPNIQEWEEFQNWMRPPAFPTFSKLIRRNTTASLMPGTYQIDVGLHWPVTGFNGKKAVYITHSSQVGGRNNFLGIVYLLGGVLCFAMAVLIVGFYIISNRKIADATQLSWNKSEWQ